MENPEENRSQCACDGGIEAECETAGVIVDSHS